MHPLSTALFDLEATLAAPLLRRVNYPWEALTDLGEFILALGPTLADYTVLQPQVWIGPGVEIASTACIQGPAIIGANTQIRHAAFIRENVLIGDHCVVGNSTEVKNAILSDGVQAPHFNYLGDSMLGRGAHLGAGAILSNFKAAGNEIRVHLEDRWVASGRNKLGGLLGNRVEIGCNAVVYPGAVVGCNSIIYPLSHVRGFLPPNHLLKADGQLYPQV